MTDSLHLLLTWTPFLLEGFAWNVFIAVCAVALGSSLGALLAWLRVGARAKPAAIATRISTILGSVPTLALIFYAVFVLPNEIVLPGAGIVLQVPPWAKAVLGLAASPLSFTAESLVVAYRNYRKGDIDAAMLFIPTWINVFLISFVASSAASLVGVSELVSRCNTVIAASETNVMVPVYLYCSLYFVATSLLFTAMINRLKRSRLMVRTHRRMALAHAAAHG
ncbi:polar amino acid ABC transporter permease [Massilia forsythiae]|uniref:Polar amino acid ABC transporter permease n=1 Tax=Massilia forsythiae TaxID=2728020 RepID=A0A7Z2ZTN3_9BURK|nr:polar amino acid ABC transporter permease [Massilia forsythiae]QJE01554.1 polar amino acid ABC transporter permease [Massilia forsythiae]